MSVELGLRPQVIMDLRRLADLLEADPAVPVPTGLVRIVGGVLHGDRPAATPKRPARPRPTAAAEPVQAAVTPAAVQKLAVAAPSAPAARAAVAPIPAPACRVCGCTDDDCSGCIARTGQPCSWAAPAAPDLCTACVEPGTSQGLPGPARLWRGRGPVPADSRRPVWWLVAEMAVLAMVIVAVLVLIGQVFGVLAAVLVAAVALAISHAWKTPRRLWRVRGGGRHADA